MPELKLTIEIVPSTSWYNNLRNAVSPEDWYKIRKKVYADAKDKCAICGASGKIDCHEVWEYDDENHIQKLSGFTALCDMCHFVKHIGFAGVLAEKGKLDFESVIRHFMAVNACNRDVFDEHYEEAFMKWLKRSEIMWTIDFGTFSCVITDERPKETVDKQAFNAENTPRGNKSNPPGTEKTKNRAD